jgi:hypothetical protein
MPSRRSLATRAYVGIWPILHVGSFAVVFSGDRDSALNEPFVAEALVRSQRGRIVKALVREIRAFPRTGDRRPRRRNVRPDAKRSRA